MSLSLMFFIIFLYLCYDLASLFLRRDYEFITFVRDFCGIADDVTNEKIAYLGAVFAILTGCISVHFYFSFCIGNIFKLNDPNLHIQSAFFRSH